MYEIILVIVGAVMAKLAEYALDAYRRRKTEAASPTVTGIEDVLRWGWDGEALLRRLIALDRSLIGDCLTAEREGTVAQWAPVFMAHPEMWILLTTGPKQIVGYWQLAALDDNTFGRALTGELLDSEITLDTVEPIDVPGIYNLYIVLLGVSPDCPNGLLKLIDAFKDRIESLARRGIFFRAVCANAFTKDGKHLCEGFGMIEIGPHKDFGTVYYLPLYPWPKRLVYKRWQEVKDHYEQAFSDELADNRPPPCSEP